MVPVRAARRLALLLSVGALVTAAIAPTAGAASPRSDGANGGPAAAPHIDNLPDPLSTKQAELKKAAIEAKLNGKAPGKVKEVARGQYVELAREGEGAIWTVLGEFADLGRNTIAQPDRTVDNTTIWVPDFNRAYFMDLLFDDAPGANSMRNFYIEQSSNRYTVNGDVTDWIPVPGDAATYDDGDPVGDSCGPCVWKFLKDSVEGWYAGQVSAGETPAEIGAYLAKFDVYDRYDYNGNGDFNEPDGYIDTFQSVHAGEGNEAGGGDLGDYAIWSHSWYAYSNLIGAAGPAFNKLGGIQIGDSDFWVGK